ncbi:MAG: flagellar biosynthetic protein FliP [Myxococcales bacterium]|nr:MAG: flagellar biosynthetic protein FliP [Myxococcales bacterium]
MALRRRLVRALVALALLLTVCAGVLALPAVALAAPVELPRITLDMGREDEPGKVVGALKLLLLLTILALAPTILITMSAFTRIIVVFFFLRQALGTQQTPPNTVLIGLALFLTFFIMKPALTEINDRALQPYLNDEIAQEEALDAAAGPIKAFMLRQTREADLATFYSISNTPKPKAAGDVPLHLAVPAFITSELKTAFQIGFLVYLPFLILDMVIASVLMSMGMMMLPPIIISLPFKIMLFVLMDGWSLLVGSLVKSFH